MFSFSSPPQSTWYRQAYTPQTPSPLRSSYNANRMATTKSSPLSQSYTSIENDKNIFSPAQTAKSLFTTPTTVASNASTTSTRFAFEQRARSSSPAAMLDSKARDGREKRKSIFLDRIRNRREDKRDERIGDQVLRMDYVKERKAWEAQMARQAEAPVIEGMEDVEMEAEQSPIEEKEIEGLVGYLEQQQHAWVGNCDWGGKQQVPSDDEYDQLFMELSQQNDTNMDMS